MREDMVDLFESAARLQALLDDEDICLVGGSASSYYAEHRLSMDHDHVLRDLRSRFDIVLDALESQGDWVTNRVLPGKVILGELGGVEAGVRQMIRKTPLEVEVVTLASGRRLTLPTLDETLRIKAFLLVKRNQTRDYLDVAALAKRFTETWAAHVLVGIDRYYADDESVPDAVASQIVMLLGDPKPKDLAGIDLTGYKGLDPYLADWSNVAAVCVGLARLMVGMAGDGS
ncbi:MAG: hypothetical protein LBL86_08480 [Coriobacteriales bacterium]|jgi:hypothetical protein|nr:hypothetical protein [Coriobacteriales bacterium]